MRESELLAHIYTRSRDLAGSGAGSGAGAGEIVIGPGDDCAVVRSASGDVLLLTVDQLVEGRHFETGTPIDLIARKAVARSVSDIAAMAGSPRWGLATGVLPAAAGGNGGWPHGDALFDAMARWSRHWGCPLVGGDIASWGVAENGRLALTVTVIGAPHAQRGPVLRSGVRAGDAIYVTGRLGGSFASGRHLRFEPRVREAAALADALGADLHAMMDISDGLGRDAARLAAASGVRIELDARAVPMHDDVRDWRAAVSEGEDYELVFAAAEGGGRGAGAAGGRGDDRDTDRAGGGWDGMRRSRPVGRRH